MLRNKQVKPRHRKTASDQNPEGSSIFPRPFQVAHLAALLAIRKDKHPSWRLRPDSIISEEDYYQDLVLRAEYLLRCAEGQEWLVYAREFFEKFKSYSYADIAEILREAGWHGLTSKTSVKKFFSDARKRILNEVQTIRDEKFDLPRARKHFTEALLTDEDFNEMSSKEQNKRLKEEWDETQKGNLRFAQGEEEWVTSYLPEEGPCLAYELFRHLEQLGKRCHSLNFSTDVVRPRKELLKAPF